MGGGLRNHRPRRIVVPCACAGPLAHSHAESLGNLDGSDADTGLSARGRLQAAALAGVLIAQTFDRVLVSPLQRACETATIALPGRAVETDTRLRELVGRPARFFDVSTLTRSQLEAISRVCVAPDANRIVILDEHRHLDAMS